MTSHQTPLSSEAQQKRRSTWLSISILAALIFSASELAALWMSGDLQIWVVLPVFLVAPAAYWLNWTGRQVQGSIALLLALNLQFLLVLWTHENLSVMNSVTSLALAGVISVATLPRHSLGRVLVGALITLIVSFFIDIFGGSDDAQAQLNLGSWIFLFAMVTAFAILFGRGFLSWDIRTKIVASILSIGALALGVFIFFMLSQTQQITDVLRQRLDDSVTKRAEEQLENTAFIQATRANQSLKDAMEEIDRLAQYWSALQGRKGVVSQRTYWDASTNLKQWIGGHYGNSPNDTSSIFIPVGVPINESLVMDLNTSAYLDFYAPGILKTYPSLLAIYAIDTRGVIRYYPNINLAEILKDAPDFDATTRPYYLISTPLFNQKRVPRWTIPYIDVAGGGLVVTVASPVYDNDQFTGIVAADLQLSNLAKEIGTIEVGQTGYAFMIDDAGRILSMPAAGYEMFGLRPEDITPEEFPKQTLLGKGNEDLQSATRRMVAGGSGLATVNVGGVDTYISYSPIKANGYSIALVVPVSELQGEIIAARNQTQQQVRSASQAAALILILLLVLAFAVSLGLGHVIAAPIQRLTQVATQIAGGDLSVQAAATTKDEIGTLAQSFNSMTARLRQTLDGLERMVEERTIELLSANEKNERRARQFESVAQVARTLSSVRDLDTLLTQITTVISREFGFYHVGIFLLDAGKEYAILSAANSEGGKRMLKRGHRLKVGEEGIVGYVTGTGTARVALDVGADAVYFSSSDLPETRSEIALPLRAGEEIMGALDVQSIDAGAFSQEDINILSTLADQVSVALQNARQFEQTRKALNEAEALARQFAQTGWQQYTTDKDLVGIRHTGARSTLLYGRNSREQEETTWDLDEARKPSRGAFLSLPIELRGEMIGSVDVRSPDNRPWDQDELDIVAAIIERAAIAMENARLLEESQRLASKEAKIGAVTARISSSINMRNVLQTAVEELGRALPGSEVVIQFQTDQNKTTS